MDNKIDLNENEADDFEYESTPSTPNEQVSSTPPLINGKNFLLFLTAVVYSRCS